ncbi:hypothetical protein C1645_743976 [Glomus cerebriforme]|uniref:Trypsin-like cysteine/serine peptidase domain-containing protein n=1 Tax=Glomus cerebriforme TaxID=658196 RepID=A0A397SBS0_9GLOM|nr:hypothetical protein C1645_743976 [Glomus cerebriforme]
MENVDIPDIEMSCVWKVQISFNVMCGLTYLRTSITTSSTTGYPVLIKYEIVKLASDPRAYHKILKPGHSERSKNACTLEVFSQKKDIKKFILIAGYAVEENLNTYKINCINRDGNLLDYTFCEVDECDRVPVDNPNKPFGSETIIHNCKDSVSNDETFMKYVYKYGRTSFLMIAIDGLITFCTKNLGQVFALLVYSVDQPFGEFGDSGSAVFDDDGQLWGIHYGFKYPYHFIVPIHLNDVQKRYEINLTLIA